MIGRLGSFVLVSLLLLALAGCGGGGGGGGGNGGGATLVGRVLSIESGGPTNPPSSVQVGSKSALTSLADGSFTLPVAEGTTSVLVDTQGAFGTFTFNFGSASGTEDIGDLWVGPEQIVLTGRVLNSTNSQPVANAAVSFAGRTGTTDAQGVFSLQNVAYSSSTQTAFWGITGTVRASGFFRQDFSTFPNTASQGQLDIGDILVTPSNDTNPPPAPYNIKGRVLPLANASGTVVTLSQGGTAVRVFNVGSSGEYFFWVTPGTYHVTYQKGGLTAPAQDVTVPEPNSVINVPDATLE